MTEPELNCPAGHALDTKTVTGLIFGIGMKYCNNCGRQLNAGHTRHSCKLCSYHLCHHCWRVALGGLAPPVPPSSAATLAPSSCSRLSEVSGSSGRNPCKWGAACYNWDPKHRLNFSHPEAESLQLGEGQRKACKYGAGCYQRSVKHLEAFVHPGDRNYREGLVVFGPDQRPEFESLWQLFQYYDPDESGHLSQQEFEKTFESFEELAPGRVPGLEQAWMDADGPRSGFISFRQLVSWTTEFLQIEYPLGLEVAGSSRPCRFIMSGEDGARCSCPGFTPAEDSSLCVCGHKPSMHRSDFAQRSVTLFLEEAGGEQSHWEPGGEGLVRIEDDDVLGRLQALVTATHKTTDNWTRDRGCLIHKVNGCAASCAFANRAPVPTGYVLLGAYRNQNQDLWQKYSLMTTAMREDTRRQDEVPLEPVSVMSSGQDIEGDPLDVEGNEWYLYHGSSLENLRKICTNNFRLALAGTGATWRDSGKAKGTPLYGYGIYLAEHITKADEYAHPLPPEDSLRPIDDPDVELYCVLMCRVFGGRARVVTTNEFEIDKLRSDVFEGPYASVFGDRVSKLGKPFREVVVYDKDQCYPEYLLVYQRSYE